MECAITKNRGEDTFTCLVTNTCTTGLDLIQDLLGLSYINKASRAWYYMFMPLATTYGWGSQHIPLHRYHNSTFPPALAL